MNLKQAMFCTTFANIDKNKTKLFATFEVEQTDSCMNYVLRKVHSLLWLVTDIFSNFSFAHLRRNQSVGNILQNNSDFLACLTPRGVL